MNKTGSNNCECLEGYEGDGIFCIGKYDYAYST